MSQEAYPPGSVVLVPFPFTDLSGRKRRPALVVSPTGLHEEDVVLCAITSRIPHRLSRWEASLEAADMVEEELPKQSIIKAGKLVTMHQELIASRIGSVTQHKLQEILAKLRQLFEYPASNQSDLAPARGEPTNDELAVRTEEVDEAVLALLHLNTFEDHGQIRAWKTFDWEATDRLYEKGFIGNPKSKAKSVSLTAEGVAASENAFRRRFA